MAFSADLPATLAALGTATLHEAFGRRGLASGLRLMVGAAFAGPAITVALPAGDNLGIHLLLHDAPRGAVACIASGGRGRYGVFGDILALAAAERGIVAMVIDDGIRDFGQFDAPPSIVAREVGAFGTLKRRVVSLHQAVALGGILIRPNDWVVGDADGLIAIPAADVERVVSAAHARVSKEESIRTGLGRGETTVALLGLDKHLQDVARQT